MATLTSDYQYLGRSAVMKSVNGNLNYYILVYGKTTASIATGQHTVSIKEVLASTNDRAEFYEYDTEYSVRVNNIRIISGTDKPSSAWKQSVFTAGGVTYKTSTDIVVGTTTIDATDGSAKEISIKCYWAMVGAPNSYTPTGSHSVTVSATLPAIPRATTPVLSEGPYTMGKALTITLTPASKTFKHQLVYAFGNLATQTEGLSTGTDFTAQGDTVVTFIPPTSLASQVMNATSGKGSLWCFTYTADGTSVGIKAVDLTLNVPDYTPEIINVSLVGNNLLNGEYAQNKSTITVSASLKSYYSAGVKSVVAEVDGETYTKLPFTTPVLSDGDKTVKITFTDTRDKSVTFVSNPITVYKYSKPVITGLTFERQSDGTTVVATVKGGVAAVNNKNTKTITVTLRNVTKTLTSDSYSINATATFNDVPTDNTLTGTAVIKDYYDSATKDAVLPTVAVTMDFLYNGTGIAMGKVAEFDDTFDCHWRLRLQGEYVSDFEIYRGTIDGWTVKKYYSGEIEAYRSLSINTTVSTAYGQGYYNGSTLAVNLPSDFLNNAFPNISINVQSTQAQILNANIAAYNQAERKISYYITSPGSQATSYQMWVHFKVVGKWK